MTGLPTLAFLLACAFPFVWLLLTEPDASSRPDQTPEDDS